MAALGLKPCGRVVPNNSFAFDVSLMSGIVDLGGGGGGSISEMSREDAWWLGCASWLQKEGVFLECPPNVVFWWLPI